MQIRLEIIKVKKILISPLFPLSFYSGFLGRQKLKQTISYVYTRILTVVNFVSLDHLNTLNNIPAVERGRLQY